MSCSRATSDPPLLVFNVEPETVWLVGPFWLALQEGLCQLKRNTQELLPPRQWFAVRKYGVPSWAQLFSNCPVQIPLPTEHTAFVYLYEGEATVGDSNTPVPHRAAGELGPGAAVVLKTGGAPARMLLLAARPLHEPVVQYGPFVMNTRQEIEQAVADYQRGVLAT